MKHRIQFIIFKVEKWKGLLVIVAFALGLNCVYVYMYICVYVFKLSKKQDRHDWAFCYKLERNSVQDASLLPLSETTPGMGTQAAHSLSIGSYGYCRTTLVPQWIICVRASHSLMKSYFPYSPILWSWKSQAFTVPHYFYH